MSKIDFSKYQSIDEIVADIKSIKIQGATNVAIATFEGIKLAVGKWDGSSIDNLLKEVHDVGNLLATARPNEPLAINGLKYVDYMSKVNKSKFNSPQLAESEILRYCDDYLGLIKGAKEKIVEKSAEVVKEVDEVLTHCHSSTAERVIEGINKRNKGDLKVVCTETRPLYQGRITAKNLVDMGIDTTMIADSAAESYIIDKGHFPVDVVFIGADEITVQGDAVNKIGSWGIALSAYFASKPVYVITSILKVNPETAHRPVEVEIREANELWPEAPEGLKMYNPAFEIINRQFITGYLTEFGLVKPEEIVKVLRENYGWVFN